MGAGLVAEPAESQQGGAGLEPNARASTVPQLRRQGRWLVDRQGRVVLIHGLNLVWKHAPYAPPATAAGFTWRDARWLKRHGFNAARIGTLWAGLTPDRPDELDPSYLAKWQRVMDLLAGQQIWMQLDFHQDQWHETYGGEGVPDWAVHRPDPFALLPPVVAPFPTGYWTPELSTVFDNFWADQDHLLSDWATAWRLTARHWRSQPYSMGYDLLNEPWAGMEWETCLLDGCPSTYAAELQPAFEKALAAIRTVDAGNIVWFEPQQFAGGRPIDTFLTSVARERNLGLSWHNYCPDIFFESQGVPPSPVADVENCVDFSNGRNDHGLGQARTMHAVPLMSEYGATDNLRAIAIDTEAADRHLMGWMDWAYKRFGDPTSADAASQSLFTDDADLSSAKRGKLLRLVRTYPQATAGVPQSLHFDPSTGAFRFVYLPDPRISAPTVVFVSPLHYPQGFKVVVRHGRVVSRDGRLLSIRAAGTDPVTVVIRRR